MKHFISLISMVFLASVLSGQSDKEALSILDRFSARALGAQALFMKFDLVTSDLKDNSRDTISGSLLMSRDKYRLDLGNNILISDGVTSWSYLVAEKEVTVNKADKTDKSFQNKPSEVFTMYKKGYRNRLVEEKTDTYLIDLYPEDLKSDLQRVRLSIRKSNLSLLTAEYRQKDGISATLYLKEYNTGAKPDPDSYTFRHEKYSGVELIDMR